MAAVQEQLEGLPGFDILTELWEGYAEEHLNTLDPYQDENGNKRRLPKEYTTAKEQKLWKKIQLKAWAHDKCFMGSCGVGMDCGLGWTVILLLIPVVGPLLIYLAHNRLTYILTKEMRVPNKLLGKMQAQIGLDLLITLPPIIGIFFGYMHQCLTRNAGMIYKFFLFLAEERKKNNVPTYAGTGPLHGAQDDSRAGASFGGATRAQNYSNPDPRPARNFLSKPTRPTNNQVVVENNQQSGFV